MTETTPRPLPFILGITGNIGAGKDTVANLLSALTKAPIMPFAKYMKAGAMARFGLTEEMVYTQEGKAAINPLLGITNRDILRLEGTEAAHPIYGNDIWVRVLHHDITLNHPEAALVIVPDTRHLPEAKWVRENGVLLHVERDSNPLSAQMSTHSSDLGVPYEVGDLLVNNTHIPFSELLARLLTAVKIHPGLNTAINLSIANWVP